jgi:hypothetical protein
MRKLLVLIAAVLTMACSNTVPSGYTPEAWERLCREHPNHAQTLQWIVKDAERAKIRQIYIKEWHGDVGLADRMCASVADPEMLGGKPGTFKSGIRELSMAMSTRKINTPEDRERWLTAVREIDAL